MKFRRYATSGQSLRITSVQAVERRDSQLAVVVNLYLLLTPRRGVCNVELQGRRKHRAVSAQRERHPINLQRRGQGRHRTPPHIPSYCPTLARRCPTPAASSAARSVPQTWRLCSLAERGLMRGSIYLLERCSAHIRNLCCPILALQCDQPRSQEQKQCGKSSV